VCATSNYQSGVVKALTEHPLPDMLAAGLDVTINTDDPSVSRITLSHEYQHVCEELNISIDALRQSVEHAAQASFLDDVEKAKLVALLRKEMTF